MEIDFGHIFRTSTTPAWKGNEIEIIEDGSTEYEGMRKEEYKKTNLYIRNF